MTPLNDHCPRPTPPPPPPPAHTHRGKGYMDYLQIKVLLQSYEDSRRVKMQLCVHCNCIQSKRFPPLTESNQGQPFFILIYNLSSVNSSHTNCCNSNTGYVLYAGLHFGSCCLSQSLRFGLACSKLTTWLVNKMLKFQAYYMQNTSIFLLIKYEEFLHCTSPHNL